ncbi:hypothetical protein ACIOEX_33000, partial [Streptomyces sp. NPDC087850]
GASVTYLVRPGGEPWDENGLPLFRLRRPGTPVAERLRPAAVITDADLKDEGWDAVWLCVSSTALHEPWVRGLRDRIGGATVVTIGQDPRDLPALAALWPDGRIVQVVPSVLAYQAPLTDEVPSPGVAYWVPPGMPHTVIGEETRTRRVAAALRAGGARARRTGRAGSAELGAARMIPYIAALEGVGWSLPALRARLGPAASATREAVAVTAALQHREPPRLSVPAPAAGVVLRALPLVAPFDLPRYLEAHFTKVAAQTRQMLDTWITEGAARGLPVDRLRELRENLERRDARMP